MIDDQIDHHAQAQVMGLGDHLLDLGLRGFAGFGVQEIFVDLEVVGDGVETAGMPRLLNRVDEYLIEAHGGGTLQMRLPAPEGAASRGNRLYIFIGASSSQNFTSAIVMLCGQGLILGSLEKFAIP